MNAEDELLKQPTQSTNQFSSTAPGPGGHYRTFIHNFIQGFLMEIQYPPASRMRSWAACAFSCLVLAFFSTTALRAQTMTILNPNISLVGDTEADEFCAPGSDIDGYNEVAFNPGYPGADYGVYRAEGAREAAYPCASLFCLSPHSKVWANTAGRAALAGDGSNSVGVTWQNWSSVAASVFDASCCWDDCDVTPCPTGYYAHAESSVDFSFDIQINSPTPQALLSFGGGFLWAAAFNNPESSTDDEANLSGTITVDGANLDPSVISTMIVNDGQVLSFSINTTLEALIQMPPEYSVNGGCRLMDFASAAFSGYFDVKVTPVGTPATFPGTNIPPYMNWGTLECSFFTFSNDIGADTELSDPHNIGNEYFDPGDMYVDFGLAPPIVGGEDGYQDDETLFAGFDPDPATPDAFIPPASAAPVELDDPIPAVNEEYFDLDGSDNVDFVLSAMTYGPGNPSIPVSVGPCLFEPYNLYVSFDDDDALHYTNSAWPSVPTTSLSSAAWIYGQPGNNDEIVGWEVNVSPFGGPATPGYSYGLTDEEWLHAQLTPNPDPSLQEADDDVDALDAPTVHAGCDVWYFSADHEAVGQHTGTALLPGVIYENAAAGPLPVIDPSLHLGIGADADIDAFEFAVLWDPAEGRNGLALLFSVDEDDILTLGDETGGLDPTVIYSSFLNGSSQEFLDNSADDIDAIAIWDKSLRNNVFVGQVDPRLYVEETALSSGSNATSFAVFVGNSAVNTVLNWNPVTPNTWISVTQTTAIGAGWVIIDLDENTTGSPRLGTVEIVANGSCPSVTIDIYQSDVPKRGADGLAESGAAQLLTPQPHPVAESTVFGFVLEDAADLTLSVYDLRGRRIATVAEGDYAAGEHQITWTSRDANGAQLPAGVYELRLQLGGESGAVRRSFAIVR